LRFFYNLIFITDMQTFKLVLTYVFGLLMMFGGIMHFINAEIYNPFIPDFLPKDFINYASGLLEIMLGIGAFVPNYRAKATMGILILMLAFLPLHVMDVFKENPAIGNHELALIRLPLQFILILWAWLIAKK